MEAQHRSSSIDRTREDVGNIVEFGHVNVQVPSQHLATLFYVGGLGLTRDPYLMTGVDNMWINVGLSQFHLPTGPAQVLRGVVGLVLPDLSALLQRLERVRPSLADTRFGFALSRETVEVTCPWGNHIRCHAPATRFGAVRLGIAYVELEAPRHSVVAIAAFYREVLGALVDLGSDDHGEFVCVGAGPHTVIVYRETDRPIAAYDGHHLQITLADFSGPHRRLAGRGLVSAEDGQHQWRFEALQDLTDGRELLRLEHEVRSMRHPLFGRPLVNRNPHQSNVHFAPGYESFSWAMPAG